MKRYLKFSLLIACFVLFSLIFLSCSSFFPHYKKPETKIPENWNSENSNRTEVISNLPYLAWWKNFNDPVLDSLIEEALESNLTIQMAKANMEAAQAQLDTIKMNWLPFISLFGGYVSGNSQNTFTSLGSLGVIGNAGAFIAVVPQYTINLFRNYAMQKQAVYLLNMSEADVLSVRLAIVSQLVSAYFTCLAQMELTEEFNTLAKKVSELIEINERMKGKGLATNISIADLKAQQQLIYGQTALVKRSVIAAQNAILHLINRPPGTLKKTGSFAGINPLQVVPGNLPVSVIESRPDIIKAEAQLKAANAGVGVASSALLPGISLNYFYAGTNSSVNENPYTDLKTSNHYFSAIGDWSLSASALKQIDVNRAGVKVAIKSYQAAVNTALHEVDNAFASNAGFNQKSASDAQALSQLCESINLKESLYRKGLLPYTILIGAELEKDLLEIVITQTKLQQLFSLVVLYQTLGGGYRYKYENAKTNSDKKG